MIIALDDATHLAAQGMNSIRQTIPALIGGYDARTGEPLPGVRVRDSLS